MENVFDTFCPMLKVFPALPGEYNISRRGRSAKSYFSCVVYHVLARYLYFLMFTSENVTKTIIRLIFTFKSYHVISEHCPEPAFAIVVFLTRREFA